MGKSNSTWGQSKDLASSLLASIMSTNAFYLQSSTSSSFTKNALVTKRIRCWCGRKTPLFLQRIKVYARLLKTGLIHLLAVLRKRALFRENQSKRKLNNKKESRSALMLRVRIYLWSKYTDQSLNDDARQFLEKKKWYSMYIRSTPCLPRKMRPRPPSRWTCIHVKTLGQA